MLVSMLTFAALAAAQPGEPSSAWTDRYIRERAHCPPATQPEARAECLSAASTRAWQAVARGGGQVNDGDRIARYAREGREQRR